jgi:redox-sensitive bicupin YhaK (pirin superfamily)
MIIPPHIQNIGFTVKRLLPSRLQQRVGPFIFFDHMGPAHFAVDTKEGDVRQHPHIGLATVTYLFSGAMMHRDSLGVVQRIEPGAINLMTAGKGIVHSERIPEDIRINNIGVEGIQIWLALPTDVEDCEPAFDHYAAEQIPEISTANLHARVLIGKAFDLESPVKTASVTTYIDIHFLTETIYAPNFPQQELAIYLVSGSVKINDEKIPESHLVVLSPGAEIFAEKNARIILLGGQPLTGERFIVWNFVGSTREKVRAAAQTWSQGGFTRVPDEEDWIPLPEAWLAF